MAKVTCERAHGRWSEVKSGFENQMQGPQFPFSPTGGGCEVEEERCKVQVQLLVRERTALFTTVDDVCDALFLY